MRPAAHAPFKRNVSPPGSKTAESRRVVAGEQDGPRVAGAQRSHGAAAALLMRRGRRSPSRAGSPPPPSAASDRRADVAASIVFFLRAVGREHRRPASAASRALATGSARQVAQACGRALEAGRSPEFDDSSSLAPVVGLKRSGQLHRRVPAARRPPTISQASGRGGRRQADARPRARPRPRAPGRAWWC